MSHRLRTDGDLCPALWTLNNPPSSHHDHHCSKTQNLLQNKWQEAEAAALPDLGQSLPLCSAASLPPLDLTLRPRPGSCRLGQMWPAVVWHQLGSGQCGPLPHPFQLAIFFSAAVLVYADIGLLSKFQVYSGLSIQNKWRKLFFTQFLLQFKWKQTRFFCARVLEWKFNQGNVFSRNDLNDPEELFTGTNIVVEIILFLV